VGSDVLSAHDSLDEVLVVDVPLVVLVTCKKLLCLLIRELLSESCQEMAQFSASNEPVTILVEMPEALDEVVAGVVRASTTDGLHDREEDLEGDPVVGAVLVDKLLHLRLGRVLTKGSHHIANLRDWNFAVTSLIIKQKCFL